jgi:hypothetical protein
VRGDPTPTGPLPVAAVPPVAGYQGAPGGYQPGTTGRSAAATMAPPRPAGPSAWADGAVPATAEASGSRRFARREKVTVVRSRSSRRLVRRIDTWTVLKVSLIFYLLMLVISLLAGIAAWHVAVSLSFVSDIQKSVRSLADDTKFVLHPNAVLEYGAAIGVVLAVVGTVLNVVAALLYNLISDIFGGVQVVVVTEPD